MVRRTFIRLQLRKSSCDRVQSGLVLFSSPYHSSIRSRDMAKSLKISFGFILVSFRAFWSEFRFPLYTFQTKKTAFNYHYPFSSFSVHKFCGRTDIFRKSFLFSYWTRIYIHLDYFSNFTPILTKVSIPFFSHWK